MVKVDLGDGIFGHEPPYTSEEWNEIAKRANNVVGIGTTRPRSDPQPRKEEPQPEEKPTGPEPQVGIAAKSRKRD